MSNDLYRLNVFVLNFVQRVQDCSGKANLLVTRAGFERLLLTLDEISSYYKCLLVVTCTI